MRRRLIYCIAILTLAVGSCYGQDFARPAIDVTTYRQCGRLIADRDTFEFVTVKLTSSPDYKAGVEVEILGSDDRKLKSYSFPKSYLYIFLEKKCLFVGKGDDTREVMLAVPDFENDAQRLMTEIYYGEYRYFGVIKERGIY